MQHRYWYVLALILAVGGCTSNPEPAKTPSIQAKSNAAEKVAVPSTQATPDAAEKVVRAVISDLLKVDSTAISMDKPISDPPLKADALDLVEMVMELEARQGVEISDAAIERYTGATPIKGPIRITPNQLASIVREAPKAQQPKKQK